jgi:hypothetical protein
MDPGARVAIAAASLAFFAIASQVLIASHAFRLPGELLQLVAVAIVPLLVFAVLDATGVWPEDPVYALRFGETPHEQYARDLTWARMGMAGAALIAAAIAFRLSGSPFLIAAIAASVSSLAIDVTIQVRLPSAPDYHYEWGVAQSLSLAAVGGAFLATGLFAQGRTRRDYTTLFLLAGIVALGLGLMSQTFVERSATVWGLVWLATALALLALSLPFQQRILAAAGIAAVLAYLARLVFDVFASANAALIMVVLGLIVVAAGVAYQRYGERLFATRAGPAIS